MACTRFAPSPTGYLHLGHAYSALFAQECARGGRFLLRIEDIDASRCRRSFEQAILDDLAWLGLQWEQPIRRQSEHLDDYRRALEQLRARELLYPCFCTRAEIRRELRQSQHAPHGVDGPLYPGTCRRLNPQQRARRLSRGDPHALRIDMHQALRQIGTVCYHDDDIEQVVSCPQRFGDVVLARKDTPTSYHLAVTVDDAIQGVTLVTRGEDLRAATDIHRLLQALLDLPTPRYRFHRLLLDSSGRKLSKRDGVPSLRELRAQGLSADELRRQLSCD